MVERAVWVRKENDFTRKVLLWSIFLKPKYKVSILQADYEHWQSYWKAVVTNYYKMNTQKCWQWKLK